MEVVATPKCRKGAYWTHKERNKFGGFDQKCFDYRAFYVGYNVTNVFHSTIKVAGKV